MTSRIISPQQEKGMIKQLKDLGGKVRRDDIGVVVTAPKSGKEVFRSMKTGAGNRLARWPDGLFDEETHYDGT